MEKGYFISFPSGPVCLSPYLGDEKLQDGGDVVIRSRGQLDEHARDQVSMSLYGDIDHSVEKWIMDKRYVPRLLVSALGFLACYFFCSLVIRDPIPMIDELLVSAVVTVLIWHALGKGDVACAQARNLSARLKENASRFMVEVDPQLEKVEDFLSSVASMDIHQRVEKIVSGDFPHPIDDAQFKKELHAYALLHAAKTSLWFEEIMGKKRHPELLASRLVDDILSGKVDAALLALMVSLGA